MTIVNQNLFRHRETATTAINNLCTIIHKLTDEGDYVGEVVQGKRLLGVFRLHCDKQHAATQVNVDLSGFDALFAANTPGLARPTEYSVGKDGYLVLHTTGHHSDLYVTLSKNDAPKTPPSFDSRKLGQEDLVAIRLWHPGSYTITNDVGKQKSTLTVFDTEKHKLHDPTKLAPVKVTLSDKGFEPSKIEKQPMQALVITVETTAAITVKSDAGPG